MEERVKGRLGAPPVVEPGRDGFPHGVNGAPGPEGMPPAATRIPAKRRRGLPRLVVFPVLLLLLGLGGLAGYRYWQAGVYYVSTDNAQIAGNLIQVGAMNAGRIDSLNADLGDAVQQDQVIGTVLLPSTLNVSQSGVPRMGFVGSENQRAEIRSSISGVVVARQANVGDTVAAGQPIVTVVDPTKLWVQAQIEETKVGRVRVGQPVDVHVDSLGKTLSGRVMAVNRASSSTFSLLPAANASGNFTKVTQLVPVKIALDYGDLPLVLGSSAGVHIRVQE